MTGIEDVMVAKRGEDGGTRQTLLNWQLDLDLVRTPNGFVW